MKNTLLTEWNLNVLKTKIIERYHTDKYNGKGKDFQRYISVVLYFGKFIKIRWFANLSILCAHFAQKVADKAGNNALKPCDENRSWNTDFIPREDYLVQIHHWDGNYPIGGNYRSNISFVIHHGIEKSMRIGLSVLFYKRDREISWSTLNKVNISDFSSS